MRTRVAADEPLQRLLDRLDEGLRQAPGRHRTERVAVQARVLGGDEALLAADPHGHSAALRLEPVEDPLRRHAPVAARLHLVEREVTERAQDVVGAVRVHRLRALGQALEVGLDVGQRLGVDQVAQLFLSEEFSQ